MRSPFSGMCVMLLSAVLAVAGAGCAEKRAPDARAATWRPMLQAALQRSILDGQRLAQSEITATATLRMTLRQSEKGVVVADSISIVKKPGSAYTATPISHKITGDTSILKDMYSAEDSKGNPRPAEEAHVTALDFGTSLPALLRSIVSPTDGATYALADSHAVVLGDTCYAFDFETGAKQGRVWLQRVGLAPVRLEVRQHTNYVIGSYRFHSVADYKRDSRGILLPFHTSSDFGYRRLFTRGTGSVEVRLAE